MQKKSLYIQKVNLFSFPQVMVKKRKKKLLLGAQNLSTNETIFNTFHQTKSTISEFSKKKSVAKYRRKQAQQVNYKERNGTMSKKVEIILILAIEN